MFQSILLDGLIVLVVLMMAAIGYNRGGMRELCTAVGVLFGTRLADAWADRWGTWVAGQVDISEGSGRFIVWVAIVTLTTTILGYGTSLAFFSRPEAGGRLYGALMGLITGIVLIAFVLTAMQRYLTDGSTSAIVADSYIARALVDGFGWILLGIAGCVVVATAFGFLIRDNEPESTLAPYLPPQASPQRPAQRVPQPASTPRVAPLPGAEIQRTAASEPISSAEPLRVREVRHWEDPVEPNPRTAFGTGWSQTWPVTSPGTDVKTPWENEDERRRLGSETPERRREGRARPGNPGVGNRSTGTSDTDALKEWLAEERRQEPNR